MSPMAPFFADWLYKNLKENEASKQESVHLEYLQQADIQKIDAKLEQRMEYAKNISSLILSLRKKTKIKVRQPLQKILIPAIDNNFIAQVDKVKDLILSEVNVKEIEYITDTSGIISKKAKPNFKILGKKLGSKMKMIGDVILQLNNEQIAHLEKNNKIELNIENEQYEILLDEVEIISDDIQGWLVASEKNITVALDITISEQLKIEGFAREIINKIQNERKEQDFNVADKITINVQNHLVLNDVFNNYKDYICNETLCNNIYFLDNLVSEKIYDINGETLIMEIQKV
jgi:isoleucyl-tRNA synthetase